MKQLGLAYFTDTHWTIVGFFIFFVAFIGILAWVYRKAGQKHYQKMGQIPLNQEEK